MLQVRCNKLIEWAEALESGKYAQVANVLCAFDNVTQEPIGYCCWGVKCELEKIPKRVRDEYSGVSSVLFQFDLREDAHMCTIYEQEEWFGIEANCIPKYFGGPFGSLTEMNDAGITFEDIAKVIRIFVGAVREGKIDGYKAVEE